MARKAKAKAKTKRKAKLPQFNKAAAPPRVFEAPAMPRGVTSSPAARVARPSATQVKLKIAEAYQLIFNTPLGKLVLADLMTEGGVLDPILETDPVSVGKRIGARDMSLHVTKMMGLRPEHFPAMAWAASDQMATIMQGA
jgi:hypothetical protein